MMYVVESSAKPDKAACFSRQVPDCKLCLHTTNNLIKFVQPISRAILLHDAFSLAATSPCPAHIPLYCAASSRLPVASHHPISARLPMQHAIALRSTNDQFFSSPYSHDPPGAFAQAYQP